MVIPKASANFSTLLNSSMKFLPLSSEFEKDFAAFLFFLHESLLDELA